MGGWKKVTYTRSTARRPMVAHLLQVDRVYRAVHPLLAPQPPCRLLEHTTRFSVQTSQTYINFLNRTEIANEAYNVDYKRLSPRDISHGESESKRVLIRIFISWNNKMLNKGKSHLYLFLTNFSFRMKSSLFDSLDDFNSIDLKLHTPNKEYVISSI